MKIRSSARALMPSAPQQLCTARVATLPLTWQPLQLIVSQEHSRSQAKAAKASCRLRLQALSQVSQNSGAGPTPLQKGTGSNFHFSLPEQHVADNDVLAQAVENLWKAGDLGHFIRSEIGSYPSLGAAQRGAESLLAYGKAHLDGVFGGSPRDRLLAHHHHLESALAIYEIVPAEDWSKAPRSPDRKPRKAKLREQYRAVIVDGLVQTLAKVQECSESAAEKLIARSFIETLSRQTKGSGTNSADKSREEYALNQVRSARRQARKPETLAFEGAPHGTDSGDLLEHLEALVLIFSEIESARTGRKLDPQRIRSSMSAT